MTKKKALELVAEGILNGIMIGGCTLALMYIAFWIGIF